jgi:hypothetical protein
MQPRNQALFHLNPLFSIENKAFIEAAIAVSLAWQVLFP